MHETENITEETENTDSVSYDEAELEETRVMVYHDLSTNLRKENSSSIKSLSESASHLTQLARGLTKGEVETETGKIVSKPSLRDVEMALKLTLGANDLMKTKLDYIKTGKELVNELHDVIETEVVEGE